MQVLISVSGEDRIQKRFRRFERNVTDTRGAFLEISEAIAAANKRSWGRGVKLEESTIEQKQQEGFPDEPLVRTGKLKASLTEPVAEGAIREILPNELRFGTSIWYGRFQQYGTATMPKHKVLKFTPTVRKLVKGLLQRHLTGGVTRGEP